eukprot:TRINITY_DN60777_c0_g1_i1.p1 TRINITY_DN60777_c0_g1~~TRINITY_DN60777_c0_g1_i1.p1  ORF type:complete len:857 (-),score=86.32 TRINITY_DN60777_c0_g1_i1:7-2577(-)
MGDTVEVCEETCGTIPELLEYGTRVLLESQHKRAEGTWLLQRDDIGKEPTFVRPDGKQQRIDENFAVWTIKNAANFYQRGTINYGDEVIIETAMSPFSTLWGGGKKNKPRFLKGDPKNAKVDNTVVDCIADKTAVWIIQKAVPELGGVGPVSFSDDVCIVNAKRWGKVVTIENPPESARKWSESSENVSSMLDSSGAWKPSKQDENQWLQITLEVPRTVVGVVTQGRKQRANDKWSECYVSEFAVAVCTEDDKWVEVTGEFNNSLGGDTHVESKLHKPLRGKAVRILPKRWNSRIMLRAGVLVEKEDYRIIERWGKPTYVGVNGKFQTLSSRLRHDAPVFKILAAPPEDPTLSIDPASIPLSNPPAILPHPRLRPCIFIRDSSIPEVNGLYHFVNAEPFGFYAKADDSFHIIFEELDGCWYIIDQPSHGPVRLYFQVEGSADEVPMRGWTPYQEYIAKEQSRYFILSLRERKEQPALVDRSSSVSALPTMATVDFEKLTHSAANLPPKLKDAKVAWSAEMPAPHTKAPPHTKAESGPRTAMELFHREKKRGYLDLMKNQYVMKQEVEVLEFIIERLQDHSKRLCQHRDTHVVMDYIHRIVHEMSEIEGGALSFDMVEIMQSSFNEVQQNAFDSQQPHYTKSIQPLPSADVIKSFFSSLSEARHEHIPGYGISLHQFGKIMRKPQEEQTDAEQEIASKARGAAYEFAITKIKHMTYEYQSWPLLHWFLEVLYASVKVNRNFTMWTYRWGTARGLQREETRLLWLALGSSLLTACETNALNDADVRRVALTATDDMSQQVLQKLTLNLTRVRAAMNANIEMANMMRNKILAVGVTVGITAGQFLANWASAKVQELWEE